MSNEDDPVDAETIRRTYTTGLDGWGTYPPEPEATAGLRDRLSGHVRLLVPEVTDAAARMRGERRHAAVHVLVRAHHLLEEGTGESPAAQAYYVRGLAAVARALLALYEDPGPLGPPTREGEIEEAVRRRMRGAGSQLTVGDEELTSYP